MKRIKTTSFILFCFSFVLAQKNTIGLISYNPIEAYPGYNLIFPHAQSTVFLLDNCGELVHFWEDEPVFAPGNTVYIMENGNLIKCKRNSNSAINDPIWAGGAGETVEVRTWENDLIASFTLNNSSYRLHHDVAPMPNGNILMIAWENKSGAEAHQAGRDTSSLSQGKIWSEAIFEWNPTIDSIVWEWHVWDHLVQDFRSDMDNFGVIAHHPELININYDEPIGHPDWLHINAIDYNPVLDQIVLSVPHFDEFWIIDHSTTTEEASKHSGGNSGKGGDLLYRWGNPMAYGRGDLADKKLFFQHDVHWVEPLAERGSENFAKIGLFNNRVEQNRSTINLIITNYDEAKAAYNMNGEVFLPLDFERTIMHPKGEMRASSSSLSSAQLLPNGNVLACSGRSGFSYELSPDGQVAWEYITPFDRGKLASQGDTLTGPVNLTFRLKRYGLDYPAFMDRDLSPIGYLELNPNEAFCTTLSVFTEEKPKVSNITIYPNPVTTTLTISKKGLDRIPLFIYDLLGRKVRSIVVDKDQVQVDLNLLNNGMYLIGTEQQIIKKFIKNGYSTK